ncbi:hypothetical protein JXA80_06930 [bacterium]|nr:hypothetical protein [candidate division CSSED10-310 bacterium]
MANGPLERLKAGTAPVGMRMAIAEGLLPLEGEELTQALGYLIFDKNPRIVETLRETLPMMPRGFLQTSVQGHTTSSDLLHFIAEVLIDDDEIIQAIILNRRVRERTLVLVAEKGPPSALEVLAQNRNKMLECPAILKNLLANENVSRVTHFALDEFRERFRIDIDVPFDEIVDLGESPEAASVLASDPGNAADPVLLVESDGAVGTIPDQVELEEGLDLDVTAFADGMGDDDGAVNLDTDELVAIAGEDIDVDFSVGDVDLESVKGFDSGWDIDTLVKEVGGAAVADVHAELDGFDDLLEFALVEDDEDDSGKDDWLGDDLEGVAGDLSFDDHELEESEEHKDEFIHDTRMRLMKMGAAEKLILAKVGSKQERAILVMDPNKKVAVAVVEGPKMTEFEIQIIAANRQVYEEVLRAIAQHREWGKSNAIRRELVLNPKTPLTMSTRMLNTLNDFILKDVIKSKEIPSALVNHAKRVLTNREKRRGS